MSNHRLLKQTALHHYGLLFSKLPRAVAEGEQG